MTKRFQNFLNNIDFIAVLFLSFVFILAGVNKLINFDDFLNALNSYKILPYFPLSLFSLSLILSEIWTGIGIMVKAWRRSAVIFGLFMLVLFTVAIFYQYIIGSKSACGCGLFLISKEVNPLHIVQNILLIFVSIFVLKSSRK